MSTEIRLASRYSMLNGKKNYKNKKKTEENTDLCLIYYRSLPHLSCTDKLSWMNVLSISRNLILQLNQTPIT